MYQTGDTPWEMGAAAPPLLEWLQLNGPMQGQILVPGCGYGHDVRAIASAAPMARVVGLDLSPSAIEKAKSFPKVGQEIYQLGDLFNLPTEWSGKFQSAFEHTCFCAIDRQRRPDYVRAIHQVLEPEGFLLAIFYLDPWDEGEEPPGGGPPFGVSTTELSYLFGQNFSRIGEMRPRSAFPGRENREVVWLLQKS